MNQPQRQNQSPSTVLKRTIHRPPKDTVSQIAQLSGMSERQAAEMLTRYKEISLTLTDQNMMIERELSSLRTSITESMQQLIDSSRIDS